MQRFTLYRRWMMVLLMSGAALSGCARFAPPVRSATDVVLAPDYHLYEPVLVGPDQWWERFGSPSVNTLVADALSGNFSIQEAAARLDQAAAIAGINRSTLYPNVNFSTDARLSETHRDEGFSSGSRNQTVGSESYDLGISANYEVDLWGRLKGDRRATDIDVFATQEDLVAAKYSVVSRVMIAWLDLIRVRRILEVTNAQLETNRTMLELNELRFQKGLATALDVFQQRQIIAQTESIIPPLVAQESVLLHELAVLAGKAPRTPQDIADRSFPDPGPLPNYGIPADLLNNRPDVRAAGLRLQSADWRVSAARADRLPILNLTAAFSFNGDGFDSILDNWMTTLAGSVTGPIFDAKRRRSEVDRTLGVVDERLSRYRGTVLIAMQEVENALVRIDRQQVYIEALRRQTDAANNTYSEALNRYRKGLVDYLPVLTALTTQQNLERSIVEAHHALLVYRVQLHVALGGDWLSDPAQRSVEEQ